MNTLKEKKALISEIKETNNKMEEFKQHLKLLEE